MLYKMNIETLSCKSIIFALFIVFISFSQATTKIWTGAVSAAWSESTNWNSAGVPGFADDVAIPAVNNRPVLDGTFEVNGLVLQSNSGLTLNGHLILLNSGLVSQGPVYKTIVWMAGIGPAKRFQDDILL